LINSESLRVKEWARRRARTLSRRWQQGEWQELDAKERKKRLSKQIAWA
jgi:hypothetical protein